MKFGVCTDTTKAPALAAAGFDFIEMNVQAHLKPLASEADFQASLALIRASALPCTAANCFLPGGLKVTGPDVDMAKLDAYVRTALSRAEQAGIRCIVFGSGAARAIPEGFDRDTAWKQLIAFGKRMAPIAEQHAVTIVVEPLNRAECNILTTVDEAGRYVEAVNHPAFRLLVDAYHWNKDHDRADDLVRWGPLLAHAHIATTTTRKAPGLEPCDFTPFFRALREGGYDGPVSVESGWNDMAAEAAAVRQVLQQAREAAR